MSKPERRRHAARSTPTLNIMLRAHLKSTGIVTRAGVAAAAHVTSAFAHHGSWRLIGSCTWDRSQLTLIAEHESDSFGRGLPLQFLARLVPYAQGSDVTTSYHIRVT